jgi:hypothetical protein
MTQQEAYGDYWQYVKDVVDKDGWVRTKDVPHLLDAYYESNTGNPIEFQKSHDGVLDPRWRPKSLTT